MAGALKGQRRPAAGALSSHLAQIAKERIAQEDLARREPVEEVSASSWSPFSIGRKLVEGLYGHPEQAAELGLSLAPGSGEAMSAVDAWDAVGRGNEAMGQGEYGKAAGEYVNFGTGVLGALPGAGIIARGTKRGAAWMDRNLPVAVNSALDYMTPKNAKDTAFAIPAWHGSPHDFDEFKLDKIGTGEGAQAYGHGLYFAEHPDVAKNYAATVTSQQQRHALNGVPIDADADFRLDRAARAKLSGDLDSLERDAIQMNDQAELDAIAKVKASDISALNKGRVYQTELDVNHEDLLDWDKPLSEQSEKVRAAIGNLPEGKALYEQQRIVDDLNSRLSQLANQRMETPEMRAEGAELSRSLLRERNKLETLEARFEDYKSLTSTPQGVQALREAGIPGIRYLDQGSRGAGEGSRNFVIFDDQLVKILGKE